MEISLENLYVDIGAKGLKALPTYLFDEISHSMLFFQIQR